MTEFRDINSYLLSELRKQLIALCNANYHLRQLASKAFDDDLKREVIHSDAGTTKLTQWGNISKLCNMIKSRSEEIEICIELAEDTEVRLRQAEQSEPVRAT